MANGILPRQDIAEMIGAGHIAGVAQDDGPSLIQPASLDLCLGDTAYRIRASFLPGEGVDVLDAIKDVTLHKIDMQAGTVLETGCVYLLPLREVLSLPSDIAGLANPKSSTGRLDVFTRVICNGGTRFDDIPAGYRGPLYIEVAPRTFPVLVRPGDRLGQIRFRRGQHQASDFWSPLRAPHGSLVLDPEEFYILASRESVEIPTDEAAEMAPIAPEIGEFRAHYAGFFDPGFGVADQGGAGSRAVLEVRGRDVPFLLRHGQPVAKLVYEPMAAHPDRLYGEQGSHYQAQGLRLSKHFAFN